MHLLGVEISSTLVQAVILFLVLGALSVLSALRLYLYLTCGRCKSKRRMDGKTVVVTGATGGIGKETAREMARRGARVILACRNLSTAKEARDEIAATTGNQDIHIMKLDLSSQKSIREFAAEFLKKEQRLHVLIHNAGTAEASKIRTEDDIEKTMATNHFGPFLLTHLLIDVMKRSKPARVVVVASELYRLANLNFNKINPLEGYLPPALYIYYISKYANICFTLELARRLEGTGVTANCLHPGLIDSGIWRNVPAPLSWGLQLIVKGFFKTPEQGAQTSVYLAVSEELEGVNGKYFMDCKESSLSSGVSDQAKGKKLWELSEELVKLQLGDPKI